MAIRYLINGILEELGFAAASCQKAPFYWEMQQGSALIQLSYHEKTGLIIGDARLCQLPPEHKSPLYQYLLVENDQLEGLSFSVQDEDVLLSLLVQDRQIDASSGKKLFNYLFEKADYYDDILVDEYGATWIQAES